MQKSKSDQINPSLKTDMLSASLPCLLGKVVILEHFTLYTWLFSYLI